MTSEHTDIGRCSDFYSNFIASGEKIESKL